MTFTFDNTIPAANNNPSDDQPIMLNNNIADVGIWGVDHIGFNSANGGTHAQITFLNNPNFLPTPATPLANGAVIYTAAGIASPATANQIFANSTATYITNAIRAFGAFAAQAATGATPLINGSNVTSIINAGGLGGGASYTINLTPGAITGTNVVVLISQPFTSTYTWTYALNQLTLTRAVGSTAAGTIISFAILQA